VFTAELKNLVFRVITSWQVILISVVLILYFALVSYVSRLHRHPKPIAMEGSPKKAKRARDKNKTEAAGDAEITEDDDLGLEE
jgi:hypothetical protein